MPPKKRAAAADTEHAAAAKAPKKDETPYQVDFAQKWADMFTVPVANEQITQLYNKFNSLQHTGRLFTFPAMPFYTQQEEFVCDVRAIAPYNTKTYAVSFYDGFHLKEVVRCSIGLVPSCAKLDGRYYYFFVPLALAHDSSTVILPPLNDLDTLVVTSNDFDGTVYDKLAEVYMSRMTHCRKALDIGILCNINSTTSLIDYDNVVDSWSIWNSKLDPAAFALSSIVTGDAFDVHVAYFEALTNTTGMHTAVLDGYATIIENAVIPQGHPFLKLHRFHSLADAPVPIQLAPVPVPPVQLASVPDTAQLDALTQELERLKAQLALSTDDFGKSVLRDVREKFPAVGQYINFTLKNMFIDDAEEVQNWQNRYDALTTLCDEAKAYLRQHVFHELTVTDIQLLDPSKITDELRSSVESWDLDTLKSKYYAVFTELVEIDKEYVLCEKMYSRSLRSKEEQYSLQLKALKDSTDAPQTIESRAWTVMQRVCDKLDEWADQPTDSEDTVSPLLFGRYLNNFMNSAFTFAADSDVSDADLVQKLIVGTGNDKLDLKALDDGFIVFHSPLKLLFEQLQMVSVIDELTADGVMGVSRLDQVLLLLADKPFLKAGLYDSDETRLFLKNAMRVKPAALKELFSDEMNSRRWVLEPGDAGYVE